nr:MarR family transcriptional regulator [Helicobacter sp. 13S00401-1]
MLVVISQKEYSQTKISKITKVDKNITLNMIDALEAKSLLKRQKNSNNKKKNLILIMPEGKKLTKELYKEMLETKDSC